MSGLEDRLLGLIKGLEEEKRLADKRAKQLYLAGASFIGHVDTPAAYAGQAGKVVMVNATPDALEFASLVAGDLPAHASTHHSGGGDPLAFASIAGFGTYLDQAVKQASSPTFDGISASRFLQVASGVPRNNLGSPTVTEMALFDTEFNNKTEFYNIANLKFYTYDGSWTEYTAFSDTNKRRFLGGDISSGIFIPNLTEKFRVEITNSGAYVWLNALYMYWSSQSHNTTVHIWRRYYSTQVWSQLTSSTAVISSWPGHMYLPFPYIGFSPTAQYDAIRIEFTPNWSGHPTYGDRDILLYRLQLWGGYPAGRRTIYYVDENKKVIFPGELTIGTVVAGTADYDKFLVSDGGLVKYRTGAQVLSDIGASASGHTHVKVDITDTPWAWTDVSKTGSNLTDLATRQHAGLTDITSDQHHAESHTLASHSTKAHSELSDAPADAHHPQSHTLASHSTKPHSALTGITSDQHHAQLHASEHHVAGGDLVNHDSLTGFVAAEHLSLPNTIANVLSDHNAAAHDALNIDADTVDSLHASSFALTTRKLDDFGTPDDNTDLNATTTEHGLLPKLYGGSVRFLRADGTWALVPGGAPDPHASDHEAGGSDLVGHDLLTGFLAAEHISLPNTIANVLSNHTQTVHNDLNIDADKLDTFHASSFLRSNADDNLTAAIIVPDANRDEGMFGTYDSAKTQHIWSMGTGYRNSPTGANFGNLYGLAYKYNGVAGGHGVYLVNNGNEKSALGTNVWTSGKFISTTAIGNVPMTITSTTKVVNLNVDRVDDLHGTDFLRKNGSVALTAAWDAGAYQIRALKFYSDQATGTAPFTVLSTTKVTNLNADLLEGYHASSAAGNNTIVLRTSSGYIYCNFLNTTSGATTSEPTHYFVETGNDSFLRQMTPTNFVAKLVADGLMPKSGGAFSGLVTARDHGSAQVDELVNVCYGTVSPPAAITTTIGTLFVKYTA